MDKDLKEYLDKKFKNIDSQLTTLRNDIITTVDEMRSLLLIGSVATIYLFFQKYLASHYYTEAAKALVLEGDVDASESSLIKANRVDARDRYHRGMAEIGIIRMRDILAQQDVAPEVLRGQFQAALSSTIQNAQKAIDLNPSDPLNC